MAKNKKLNLNHLALCKVVMGEEDPPEWIQLVPAGELIKALDGREFKNSTPQDIVDKFKSDPRDVPIDYEHSSEIRAPYGETAPAAGWIVDMEVREGAVWGKVEWTPTGSDSLKKREYRYLSPAFLHSELKNILEIVSAGLTNRPAFNMPNLAHDFLNKPDLVLASIGQNTKVNEMDEKLLKMLGLAPDATVEQAIEALSVLQTQKDETSKKLESTAAELSQARSASPELDKLVPRGDYDMAIARAEKAEQQIKEQEKAMLQNLVDIEIENALKAGKITPATADYHKSLCSSQEGLDKFKDYIKAAPLVIQDQTLDDKKLDVKENNNSLTEDQKAIARAMSLTDDEMIAAIKDTKKENF